MMETLMRYILVFGDTLKVSKKYREDWLKKHPGDLVKITNDNPHLLGAWDAQLHLVGNWWENDRYEEVIQCAQKRHMTVYYITQRGT